MTTEVKWSVAGDYYQACSCDYGCPFASLRRRRPKGSVKTSQYGEPEGLPDDNNWSQGSHAWSARNATGVAHMVAGARSDWANMTSAISPACPSSPLA